MKRFFFNESGDRVVVTIRSAPCEVGEVSARMALAEMFQNVCNNPEFLYCDSKPFERGTITHDGARWVFVVEAIVPKLTD